MIKTWVYSVYSLDSLKLFHIYDFSLSSKKKKGQRGEQDGSETD